MQKALSGIVFFLLTTFQIVAQNNNILLESLSIRFNKVSVDSALNLIEKQIPYYFSYDAKFIKGRDQVSEKFYNQPLSIILDSLLKDPYLEYRVIDKQIVIYKEEETENILSENSEHKNIEKICSGVVIGEDENVNLPYATIRVNNTAYGTVTNQDGQFIIKLSQEYLNDSLLISYMGYSPQLIAVKGLKEYNIFKLKAQSISLQEVIIRWHDPRKLLENALYKIKDNYPQQASHLRSFYRESLKRNNRYMLYIESLLDIYKSRYRPTLFHDKARLLKLRKFTDINSSDTLLFKLQGGINACIMLDIVKNPFDFLRYYALDKYEFKYEGIQQLENNKVYCISFVPSKTHPNPDFEGTIYIDTKSNAITKVQFAYTKTSIRGAKKTFVIRKKRGVKVYPKSIKYTVSYKEYNGKYYINHVLGEMIYKAKLKRKLLASKYKIHFEMITTDITTQNINRIKRSEQFKTNQILTDFKPSRYQKMDKFWEYSNNIIPESDLLKALENFKVEELTINE